MGDESKYRAYDERVRIFKGSKPDEVGDILDQGRSIEYAKGQTIFHQGMLGSNLFIVLSGEIGLYNKNKMIASCKVGDAFGEMSVLNHRPAAASETGRVPRPGAGEHLGVSRAVSLDPEPSTACCIR